MTSKRCRLSPTTARVRVAGWRVTAAPRREDTEVVPDGHEGAVAEFACPQQALFGGAEEVGSVANCGELDGEVEHLRSTGVVDEVDVGERRDPVRWFEPEGPRVAVGGTDRAAADQDEVVAERDVVHASLRGGVVADSCDYAAGAHVDQAQVAVLGAGEHEVVAPGVHGAHVPELVSPPEPTASRS